MEFTLCELNTKTTTGIEKSQIPQTKQITTVLQQLTWTGETNKIRTEGGLSPEGWRRLALLTLER